MLGQLMQGFMGGGGGPEEGGAGQGMPADLAKMLGGAGGGGSQDDEIGNLMKSLMGPQQTGQPNSGSLADMFPQK